MAAASHVDSKRPKYETKRPALWSDSYAPQTWDELCIPPSSAACADGYTSTASTTLKRLVSHRLDSASLHEFPHILLYGPSGSGKRTHLRALLHDLFGPMSRTHTKTVQHTFRLPTKTSKSLKAVSKRDVSAVASATLDVMSLGENTVDDRTTTATFKKSLTLTLHTSPFHTELDGSEVGPFKDHYVMEVLLRHLSLASSFKLQLFQSSTDTQAASGTSTASTVLVDHEPDIVSKPPIVAPKLMPTYGQSDAVAPPVHKKRTWQLIVLHRVDRLSKGAQQALRRIMEQSVSRCRFVLTADSIGSVISPIQSRCMPLRIPAFPTTIIVRILCQVMANENMPVEFERARGIVGLVGRDLRLALNKLQECRMVPATVHTATAIETVAKPIWTTRIPLMGWQVVADHMVSLVLTDPAWDAVLAKPQAPVLIPGLDDMATTVSPLARFHSVRILLHELLTSDQAVEQDSIVAATSIYHGATRLSATSLLRWILTCVLTRVDNWFALRCIEWFAQCDERLRSSHTGQGVGGVAIGSRPLFHLETLLLNLSIRYCSDVLAKL